MARLAQRTQTEVCKDVVDIACEKCFNVLATESLDAADSEKLAWLLSETYEPHLLTPTSTWDDDDVHVVVEVGPRNSFSTAFSANAVSICKACGVDAVMRVEQSRRFRVKLTNAEAAAKFDVHAFAALVHDRMTEQVYGSDTAQGLASPPPPVAPVTTVDVLGGGADALRAISDERGYAFDEEDVAYYTSVFVDKLKRNPTDVELFDIAQSNSEHSRHWMFNGEFTIDGVTRKETLFDFVRDTHKANPRNSVIAFKDNSSAIRGLGPVQAVLPIKPGGPSGVAPSTVDLDLLLTAETHNFPCAVAPYPGAETGAGGRLRDTHATGQGSFVGMGTAGYCVGNLNMPEHPPEPWEVTQSDSLYPKSLASPLQILKDASDGASDYGNKFGEPLCVGYTRTYGWRNPETGERREWIKPIMFSGGLGQIDHGMLEKDVPEVGMLVVKLGGPAYKVGLGGGAASSTESGNRDADLDFNAVQRGDGEMSQKLYRVVRTCIEMGVEKNPILSIHDQGAGGNCNCVKEVVEPVGGRIYLRDVVLGDASMSALEVWGAEYQENDVVLVNDSADGIGVLSKVCQRERLPFSVIGQVTGDGRVVVTDNKSTDVDADKADPVFDLPLELVLGKLPQKKYSFDSWKAVTPTFAIPIEDGGGMAGARDALLGHLKDVLRLPSVGSKRFLTTKVDRSVTGLVAAQQCVGPLLLPVGDHAILARSHLGFTGGATAIGEQPIKGLIDPGAMARMSLGEALTNIGSVRITELSDIKASVNWMHAAKLDADGAHMYEACEALAEAMKHLGVAVDGGKDSLSMAAGAPGESPDRSAEGKVKAPGSCVVSAYALVPDVTRKLTPDVKRAGESRFVHVEISSGRRRVGGSALAQVLSQLGRKTPDLDDPMTLASAFRVLQRLMGEDDMGGLLACHDISDGGLVVSLLEMCFSGDCGAEVLIDASHVNEDDRHIPVLTHDDGHVASPAPHPLGAAYANLFAEELGWVLEVAGERADSVVGAFQASGVQASVVGRSVPERNFAVSFMEKSRNGEAMQVSSVIPAIPTYELLREWEETSFRLEETQCLQACVAEERKSLEARCGPAAPIRGESAWRISPDVVNFTPASVLESNDKVRVCVLREEGSNGDREMCAAVYAAGMEPWDVTTTDLIEGRASLDDFRGIIFVGGFSYADVLDSAKGWAGAIRFNDSVRSQFDRFRARDDTWSLGVCNGCQLMALLGWIPTPGGGNDDQMQPRFIHNRSERFESRFATVVVDSENTNSIMLKSLHGTVCGVWIAHGEGKFFAPGGADDDFYRTCSPLRYADPTTGEATESYPYNPNGSPLGTAAVCSEDGRHLAMMPHPERCIMTWQMPHVPSDARSVLHPRGPTPWLTMFANARLWCEGDDRQ